MSFIQKYIKKARNMFHVPGEDVILIGLDDRSKSIRVYDLFVKIGSKFESKMESKVVEGNVAQVFIWYARKKIDHLFTGYYDESNPNLLHVEFTIDKREGSIFKTDDKPEGIAYLADMQTGQGVQLIRKGHSDPITAVPKPSKVRPVIEESNISDDLFEGGEYAWQDSKGNTFNSEPTIVPKQIRLHRDPVIDMLVSINPFFWGSTIDSFIATELLRGRVEMWKTIIVGAGCLIFGLLIGMGMK